MQQISSTAKIGENTKIGYYTVIEDNVIIGQNCHIANSVIIYAGTVIGDNVRIDDHTVIGKQPMKAVTSSTTDNKKQPPCQIGSGCTIGTSVVIYAGCTIGDNCLVADLASVREQVTVGEKTIIGRGVTVENQTTIGNKCKLESNAYITAYSTIEDEVFIAPCVATSNDNDPMRKKEGKTYRGITAKKYARIGTNATILPGKVLEENAFVGAGSVATKDVEQDKIVVGNPAREKMGD